MPEAEETAQVYGDYYASATGEAIRQLESEALGIDWGGNGYTTRDQAESLAELLQLDADSTLADLGSGAGWPALYLAARSGCHALLSDLAASGMRAAARRAAEQGVERVRVAVASATDPPFADGSVDAVSHTDLLC